METLQPSDLRAEILLIEDDGEIRRVLRTALSAEHYRFRQAGTATEGLEEIASRLPDVIVLDLGLPDRDGMDVIRQVRQWNKTLPILVLSVRARDEDKVLALDAGADDFVSKPFAVSELLARLRVALRRSTSVVGGGVADSVFRVGDIEVDTEKRRVVVAGKEVHLTRIEYKLLHILIRHADLVVTHSQLLTEGWGPKYKNHISYLRVYMLQLRRKLEADPTRPRHIRTEPGVGYRLVTEPPYRWG